MKTLRLLVAVGLLLGSYTIGMAQSNGDQNFKSDAEKQAWINNNSDEPTFSSEAEKEAWIQANPEKYEASKNKQTTTRANVQVTSKNVSTQTRVATAKSDKVVLPANTEKATTGLNTTTSKKVVLKKRVNNTIKAVPADYKPLEPNQTKEQK